MRTLFVLTMVVVMLTGCGEKVSRQEVNLPQQVETLVQAKGMENQFTYVNRDPCLLSTLIKDARVIRPEDFVRQIRPKDDVYVVTNSKNKSYFLCHKLSKVVFTENVPAGCRLRNQKLSADRTKLICTDDTVPLEPNELQLR